jgi:hypothetical protein
MGQIAAAMKNPNTMAPDPSGFSGPEWGTRIAGKGLQGLGQGLQNYSQQNQQLRQPQGGMMPNPSQGAMPAMPDFIPKGNNLAFYGQGQ